MYKICNHGRKNHGNYVEKSIQWRNRVCKKVCSNEKCFENTYDKSEAKEYGSVAAARGIITKLNSYGEGENNTFLIIDKCQ